MTIVEKLNRMIVDWPGFASTQWATRSAYYCRQFLEELSTAGVLHRLGGKTEVSWGSEALGDAIRLSWRSDLCTLDVHFYECGTRGIEMKRFALVLCRLETVTVLTRFDHWQEKVETASLIPQGFFDPFLDIPKVDD